MNRISYKLITTLAFLCILLCLKSPVHAEPTFAMRFLFSIDRYYQDKFGSPAGIFIDRRNKELYATDSARNRIYIYDFKGTPVASFEKVRGISRPFDLVVKDERIYLSQEGKPYIEVFNYRGESVARIAPEGRQFSPKKLQIDDDGTLYVINAAETNCAVFDKNGKFIKTIGKNYTSMSGIAITGDRIYILSPLDGLVIRVYDKEGKYLKGFEGLQGTGGGTLNIPLAAEIDKKGRLWVVDAMNGIIVYDKDHREIFRFSEMGNAKGQLYSPIDIDFGDENMIYISEEGNKRISVFKFDEEAMQ